MDPKELFRQTLRQAEPCILKVRGEHLGNSTPCADWDLRALLNHLVYELLWVPELLNGKTVQEIGDRFEGDVLGDDPVNAWKSAAAEALSAVERTDMDDSSVHLSRGEVPASQYINEISNDVLIHGWDIAQSINCSLIFDEGTAQAVYDFILQNIEGYRNSGSFGDEVVVPEGAKVQTKLLALEGRRERP